MKSWRQEQEAQRIEDRSRPTVSPNDQHSALPKSLEKEKTPNKKGSRKRKTSASSKAQKKKAKQQTTEQQPFDECEIIPELGLHIEFLIPDLIIPNMEALEWEIFLTCPEVIHLNLFCTFYSS